MLARPGHARQAGKATALWRRLVPLVVFLALLVGGCSKHSETHAISVFAVTPGDCFKAPTSVKVQLSSLTETACSKPHTQEAYAIVAYSGASTGNASAGPTLTTSYPGEGALSAFAQGACAQRFRGYVGVDYLDSKLFFTYLLPSPRSWEQGDDRAVICFVTTTGTELTASVKNTKQ